MPVSNPSAFPPPRSGDQIVSINAGKNYVGARSFLAGQSAGDNSTLTDIIVIGDEALSSGPTAAQLTGTIAIGSQALKSLLGIDSAGRSPVGNTVLGFNAATSLQYGGANTVIGANALQDAVGLSSGGNAGMTIVGANAAQNITGTSSSNVTIVGFNSAVSDTGIPVSATLAGVVMVGSAIATSLVAGTELTDCVVIGANAGANLGSSVTNSLNTVLIGPSAGASITSATNTVLIGDAGSPGISTHNVGVGSGAAVGQSYCTVLGAAAGSSGTPGNNCVLIGAGAGSTAAVGANAFIVETIDAVPTQRSMFYGDMGTGCLIVGDSNASTRDIATIGGQNILKLLNGAKGSGSITPPVGGGFFYVDVVTGLHWVGTSGTDTVLAPQ